MRLPLTALKPSAARTSIPSRIGPFTGATRADGMAIVGAGGLTGACTGDRGGVGAVLLQPNRPIKNKPRHSNGREARNVIYWEREEV